MTQQVDEFSTAVRQCTQGAAGDRLIKLLSRLYVERPSFRDGEDSHMAAVRDGERRLALKIIRAARAENGGT